MSENLVEHSVPTMGVPAEKLYTKRQVKTRKTVSFIEGLVLGAVATLTTGVILSKTGKVNLTDAASSLADKGISKIKSIPSKLKKVKDGDTSEE
jgi:hypothetical protein